MRTTKMNVVDLEKREELIVRMGDGNKVQVQAPGAVFDATVSNSGEGDERGVRGRSWVQLDCNAFSTGSGFGWLELRKGGKVVIAVRASEADNISVRLANGTPEHGVTVLVPDDGE